jgi:hypothetical protein
MGGCGCRGRDKEEELGICQAEKILGLHNVSAKQFDQEIRRVAVQHVLTV